MLVFDLQQFVSLYLTVNAYYICGIIIIITNLNVDRTYYLFKFYFPAATTELFSYHETTYFEIEIVYISSIQVDKFSTTTTYKQKSNNV